MATAGKKSTAKKTAPKKSASAEPLVIAFEVEKDTKNTRKYAEVTESEFALPVIGSLYVQKSALAELNGGSLPDSLTVTVEVG